MCFCSWTSPRPPGIERLSLIFERLLSVLGVSAGLQTDSRHGSLSFEGNRLGVGMFSRDLQPGCDNGCERASTGKDDRAPIIASPHPAPVFYPVEAILDSMAGLVEFGVVVDFIFSIFSRLDTRLHSHFLQQVAQLGRIVAAVAKKILREKKIIRHNLRAGVVARPSACQKQEKEVSARIGDTMQLGAQAARRPVDAPRAETQLHPHAAGGSVRSDVHRVNHERKQVRILPCKPPQYPVEYSGKRPPPEAAVQSRVGAMDFRRIVLAASRLQHMDNPAQYLQIVHVLIAAGFGDQ